MPAEKSATFRRFFVILMSSCEKESNSFSFLKIFQLFIVSDEALLASFFTYRLNDNMWDDGNSLGPKEVHNYLTRVMYNRRNKFNPLWNTLVLGGVKNGQSYLGMVTSQDSSLDLDLSDSLSV